MDVHLEKKKEFELLLRGYEPSDLTKNLLKKIPLVILLGVTGAGRNTVINHMVNSKSYHFVVSDTTRPPKLRDGKMEENGVQYNFRDEEDMLNDLQQGKYLEAELIHDQQVSGISLYELQQSVSTGKIPVNEVDLGGTIAIRRAKPDTHFFFVIPPSFKEWMYRLHGREIMTDKELSNRLRTATRVLDQALKTKDITFVINDSSQATARYINERVQSIPKTPSSDHNARIVAQQILAELES